MIGNFPAIHRNQRGVHMEFVKIRTRLYIYKQIIPRIAKLVISVFDLISLYFFEDFFLFIEKSTFFFFSSCDPRTKDFFALERLDKKKWKLFRNNFTIRIKWSAVFALIKFSRDLRPLLVLKTFLSITKYKNMDFNELEINTPQKKKGKKMKYRRFAW